MTPAHPVPQAEESPSERSFGLTVGGVLVALGGVRVGVAVFGGVSPPVDRFTLALWGLGGVLLALALLRPAWLTLPNRLWQGLGRLLARVVNPVVLLLLYVTCILPVGLVMRAFGHDPLRRKPLKTSGTYWVAHEPSPLEDRLRHPF